jgi:hypothetical protein
MCGQRFDDEVGSFADFARVDDRGDVGMVLETEEADGGG